MRSKLRLFLLLTVLAFIIHFAASLYVADRLTDAIDHHAPAEQMFAPSFAAAALALPLLHWSILNDVLAAALIAAAIVFLRWRAIAIPPLIIVGMMITAKVLDARIDRGFSELAPRALQPAPRGTLVTTLGDQSIEPLNAYLTRQLASGDESIDPLPQEVDWFLVAHRSEIDALQHQLPVNDAPLARFRMQKILLVDALQTRSSDEIAAAERLTDPWLHEAGPDPVLYAIAAAKNQIGVIRKLHAAAPEPAFDPHQQMIDAIAAKSKSILEVRSPWYAWPYAELCKAESALSGLQEARRVRDLRGRTFPLPPEDEPRPRVPFNPTGVLGGGARFAWRANDLVSLRARRSS